MLTAEIIKELSELKTYSLGRILAISGYSNAAFKIASFVGIDENLNFVYETIPFESTIPHKVYVKYIPNKSTVSADYFSA